MSVSICFCCLSNVDFSRFNPWLSLPRAAPLEKAISIFATGIHHIALTEENKAVAVLSQVMRVDLASKCCLVTIFLQRAISFAL